jgi:hypothetical protein
VLRGELVAPVRPQATQRGLDALVAASELVDEGLKPLRQRLHFGSPGFEPA